MIRRARLNRLWPRTIRGQMMAIILCAVLFVSIAGDFTAKVLSRFHAGPMDVADYALAVSPVAQMVASLPPGDRPANIARWKAIGIEVALVDDIDAAALAMPPTLWDRATALLRDLPDATQPGFQLIPTQGRPVLIYPLDGGRQVLAFPKPPHFLLGSEVIDYFSAVMALVIGFWLLAVRGIAMPVRRMAAVMKDTDRFLASDRPVPLHGPREMRDLALGLNDLRDRIRRLLDSRNAMLRSVSHDLRTPLTRLRLRIERIGDPGLRRQVLQDVAQMEAMIGATLDYLRDGAATMTFERCDVASLLDTICADFADSGVAIAYVGPRHLVIDCAVGDLTRAINNLCENGLKFGRIVQVAAEDLGDRAAIHVRDDGPGIPADLRDRVLHPFVKLDPARGGPGFGLGLSIASEIVARHCGTLQLLDNDPHGLHVLVCLPKVRLRAQAGTSSD